METKNIDVKRFSNKLLNHGDSVRKMTVKVTKDIIVPDRGDSIKTGTAFTKTIDVKNNINTKNEVKKAIEKNKTILPPKADDKSKLEPKINHKESKDDQKKRSDTTSVKNNEKTNHKVPLITTLTTKNDSKCYNITFKEQKQQKSLKINIPSVNQKSNRPEVPKKSSKTNMKVRKSQRFSSPVLTKKASPPTEISKWSPYSRHARPYYDAWVNFASIPENTSKLAKDVEFQRQLERLESTELVYESFTDETFTGKIKVNHRYMLVLF